MFKRKILHNIYSNYILLITIFATQILLIPFYIAHLNKKEFGLFIFYYSFINFSYIFIGIISGGILRKIIMNIQYKKYINEIISHSKLIYICYIFIYIIIIIFCMYFFGDIGENYITILLLIFNLLLIYEGLVDKQLLISLDYNYVNNYLESIKLVINLIIIYIMLPIYESSYVIWVSLAISQLIHKYLFLKYIYFKEIKCKIEYNLNNFNKNKNDILSKANNLFYISAFIILLQSDVFIIGFLGNSNELANYYLIWKIPEAIILILYRIPSSYEPMIYKFEFKNKLNRLNNIYINGIKYYFMITIIACLLYSIFGNFLNKLWFGDSYTNELWVYIGCSFLIFTKAMFKWPITYFYNNEIKQKLIIYILLLEFIIKNLLIIFLYKYYGEYSVVISSLFINVFILSGLYFYFFKSLKLEK